MSKRNRFVQPDVVRLQLSDVHKRAHEELLLKGVQTSDKTYRKATNDEIAASEKRLADAIEDGAWIDVKKELNAGENRRVFARIVKTMHFNEKAEIDPEQVGLSKIAEFLVAWSLTDSTGRVVPISEAAINNLDSDTYAEIVKAIDEHEAAGDAARDARKNSTGGESKSLAISSSAA